MVATELSDVLFGTPKPVTSRVNLGVLDEKKVNIVVHGHEPILSEMLAEAVEDSELVELAKMEGATGINLCGMCCTANELLMRRGIPVAGNFLNQEFAIVTGAVEAMVVDVQCIMPSLVEVAKCYHTLLLSTSPKAKFPNTEHIEFDEEKGFEMTKALIKKDILVIETGCSAIACAKAGLLLPDAAAPEWMSEKAVSIGAYAVASGIFTLLGLPPAIMGSSNVVELLTEGAESLVGGKFAVETNPIKAAEMIIDVIENKRKGLGI